MRPPPDCRPAVGASGPQGHVSLVKLPRRTCRVSRLEVIPTERRVESFADDLNTRRGIVSGRVALLPRSTEIQPFVASIRPPSSHYAITTFIFRHTTTRLALYYTSEGDPPSRLLKSRTQQPSPQPTGTQDSRCAHEHGTVYRVKKK